MAKSFADDFLKNFEELPLPLEITARFEPLQSLAQNDTGETLLLLEKEGGKRFVLKCYKKTETTNAAHEAELLRGLEHKGLPRFETEIETPDFLFVLYEFVDGVPLEQYLEEHPVDEALTVDILLELCDIVAYLHSQPAPIIHRDIKPTNIIIDPTDTTVTLIDFGISRKYSEGNETDTACFGTQRFAPPEQFGYSQTDCRADIYALGIVLRYMLTRSTDRKAVIKDKALEKIAAKCAAFSPDARYQNTNALKKALIKYKKHAAQKAMPAIASICIACLVFFAGFALGRYTDVLQYRQVDPENTVYSFTEPLIEKAARLMLNKTDGQPVTRGELRSINSLYIVGGEAGSSVDDWYDLRGQFHELNRQNGTIESLDDLSFMDNLAELHIMAQPLSDLSPLSGLDWLTDIEIIQCNVADVTPLISLPRLDNLELFGNPLSDFTRFAGMKSLTGLSIGYSRISSLPELGDMPQLERLLVHKTLVTSLDGIERFPFLEMISISETNIKDFSPLDDLPHLEKLYISADMERYSDTLNRSDVEVIIQ